jgi:hypothetical protein
VDGVLTVPEITAVSPVGECPPGRVSSGRLLPRLASPASPTAGYVSIKEWLISALRWDWRNWEYRGMLYLLLSRPFVSS